MLVGLFLPAEEGRIVRLQGRNFSLQLVEPEGWTLDTGSARQLANFILYPEGSDWRNAASLISVRLVSRGADQEVKDYVSKIGEEFQRYCPAGEHTGRDADLSSPFSLYDFHCPSSRDEIIAVTSVPDYFVNISLSSQKPAVLEEAYPVLKTVLESFQWKQETKQPTIIAPDTRQ